MSFEDKIVIITGAGKGLGHGIAYAFAEQGAKVIIAEKNPKTGKETTKKLKDLGWQAHFILTDVERPEQIESLILETEALYGNIDILINNAGISEWKSPYDLTLEEWDKIINVNLRGVFLCSREAAKVMRKNKGGSIVNIASTRAIMSEPNSEAYAASKGGIVSLTHALATSFSSDKIQVNCISPGWIENEHYDQLREIDHRQHLAQRVGKPEDIAKACLYLTAEGNNFITGTNIVIDGGMTRKMIYEE